MNFLSRIGMSSMRNFASYLLQWFTGVDWTLMMERKVPSPIIPRISGPTDTTNFDPYPDSVEEAALPVYSGRDPFAEF